MTDSALDGSRVTADFTPTDSSDNSATRTIQMGSVGSPSPAITTSQPDSPGDPAPITACGFDLGTINDFTVQILDPTTGVLESPVSGETTVADGIKDFAAVTARKTEAYCLKLVAGFAGCVM
jgi:hypothetical protein